ncbi:MAG: hypothetical protein AAF394_01790 [Planctomycetota bacterium]
MLLVLQLIFSVLVSNTAPQTQEAFYLTVGGEYTKYLHEGTRLRIWDRDIRTAEIFEWKSEPIALALTKYRDRVSYVDFINKSNEVLCSVRLSEDLFDKPRKIKVLLNEPVLRLSLPHPSQIFKELRFVPSISKRMIYRELPRLDEETGKLGASVPPQLKVVLDGRTLSRKEMCASCFAEKWAQDFNFSRTLQLGRKHELQVVCDSGGLFESDLCSSTYVYSAR